MKTYISPNIGPNNTDLRQKYRVMVFAMIVFHLLFFTNISAFAQTVDWNQANTGGASSAGFWQGISTVYSIIYGVFWVVAAISFGIGWMKFKHGDTMAALQCAGGGAGLGLTPFLVQWFRAFSSGGQIM